MKQKYINSIKHKIWDYSVANYIRVDDFTLGELTYNYKCYLNAVQKVKEGKASKVFACVAIDKTDWKIIIVHFINQLKNGKYQDNTWGYTQEEANYYLIREIKESEFSTIEQIFASIQESLVKANSSKLIRKLLKIKTDII